MEIPEVPVTVHQRRNLSAPAFDLWASGELLEELGIRDDGRVRVEIIGGEIVVSPGPTIDHARIVGRIARAVDRAGLLNPDYPWESAQNLDFSLARIAEGFIPDLVVLDRDVYAAAAREKARFLTAGQAALVVEVTSRWNADEDREPGPKRTRLTKWNGYALVGVPRYLLVERDPRRLGVTLYTEPDTERGLYQAAQSWKFGETVALPDPFDIEIPTDEWEAWDED